jgi:hypothetical protein
MGRWDVTTEAERAQAMIDAYLRRDPTSPVEAARNDLVSEGGMIDPAGSLSFYIAIEMFEQAIRDEERAEPDEAAREPIITRMAEAMALAEWELGSGIKWPGVGTVLEFEMLVDKERFRVMARAAYEASHPVG